jgi:hypothetical protein
LGSDTWRLPHFLNNRFTEDGEVDGLMRRPLFTPRKILGTHFSKSLSLSLGFSVAVIIRSLANSSDLNGNAAHDLLTCSIVPQPTERISCKSST